MKIQIIALVAILSLFAISNEAHAQGKERDAFTVQVDGLGCPFCAYGLEKKFKELKGIKDVVIDMETGILTFAYPSMPPLTLERVAEQVDKAGYTPVSVEIVRYDGRTERSNDTDTNTETVITDEAEFFVAGNCGMCKARIENAATKVKGVATAVWDQETKMLNIEFDDRKVNPLIVAKTVAESGHDTKTAQADADTYRALPGCCKHDRINH